MKFIFNISNDFKQNAGEVLSSKGFSNFEIIALLPELEDSPVFIDLNNGNIFILNSPFGNKGSQFINSSLGELIESLLFHEEFMKSWEANEDSGISEFDCITEDMVKTLFTKIESIDSEAVKNGNFWKEYISQEILCYEGHKMVAQKHIAAINDVVSVPFSIETIPSVLDLPAWKVLHP